jgi:acetyl esterase/lipase
VPHVSLSETGELLEHPNPCPELSQLMRLTELESAAELFVDDVLLHSHALASRQSKDEQGDGGSMGARKGWKTEDPQLSAYALATTRLLIEKAASFAASRDKKILFVLSYSPPTAKQYLKTGERFDASLVDWLRDASGLAYVDLLAGHAADYRDFSCSPDDYAPRYWIGGTGHYSPTGNLFCAHQILPHLKVAPMRLAPPFRSEVTGNQRAVMAYSRATAAVPGYVPPAALADTGSYRLNVEFDPVHGLVLDTYTPAGPGPHPYVVLVHGGGFVRGTKVAYLSSLFAPLSAAGWGWFTVQYRMAGSFSTGGAQQPARCEDLVRDVETAIAFVKENAAEYRVDLGRTALLGESAGGHLVSLIGARMQARPATALPAVVSFYGPHDLVETVAARGGQLGEGLAAMFGDDATGADLAAGSPSTYLHPAMPPYLLLHGPGSHGQYRHLDAPHYILYE